jgi:sialic acid synthase SpsE
MLTGQQQALDAVTASNPNWSRTANGAFVVAEIGCNHAGSLPLAQDMIRIAAQAGAHAVKLQKRHPRVGLRPEAFYQSYRYPSGRRSPYGYTYGEHRLALELTESEYIELVEYGREVCGVPVFASAWDVPSVEFLARVDTPIIKIGSPVNQHRNLVHAAQATGIPIVASTGFIGPPPECAVSDGASVLWCHTTSSYPTKPNDLYLAYSSHSGAYWDCLAAVALGAVYLEVHFTLNVKLSGTDHSASLTPSDLAMLCIQARKLGVAMQNGSRPRGVLPCEESAHAKFLLTLDPEA